MTTPTPERSFLPTPRFDHISDYEDWATQNWVHAPGSVEAQIHAREKFDEEIHELIAAISTGTPEEIASEAGDVVWTAAATGSNAGITITESFRTAFPSYFGPRDLIKLEAIDSIALTLLGDSKPTIIKGYLEDAERVLGKKANMWFKLGRTVNSPERTFADAWLQANRIDAVEALAKSVLLASFVAHQYAGKDLRAILSENYQKIEQRIQAGKAVTKPPKQPAK